MVRYLYHGTWVLPVSITAYEFDSLELKLNVDSIAMSRPAGSSPRVTVQKSSLDVSGFGVSSDSAWPLLRIDFGTEAISVIQGVLNPGSEIHVESAALQLLEFGVIGIFLDLRSGKPIDVTVLENSVCARVWDGLTQLFPMFDGLLAQLEKRGLVATLSSVPRLSCRVGDKSVVPHRYDLVLAAEDESAATRKLIVKQLALDSKPLTINGASIYPGFALHMVCCDGSLAPAATDSLQRTFLLGCGPFVAAADTAVYLTDQILAMLNEGQSLRSRDVRSLILFAECVLQRANDWKKGALTQIEIELLNRYNLKGDLQQEIEKLYTAERLALLAVEQREKERSSRAERAVQAILFSLTAITLFSVAKDILDFWTPDLEKTFVLISPHSIVLAVLMLCVGLLSILGVRTIRRE